MPIEQKTLKFCLQAYLDATGSTLKSFVVDLLESDVSPANFAIDEPDLTRGQKWDAHQPIKTEPISRFLSGKQEKLSPTYVEAIVPFLQDKGFLDPDQEFNFLERPPNPHKVVRDYVALYPGNPFEGQAFFRPARSSRENGVRGLRFWNRTELLPLVHLTVFASNRNRISQSESILTTHGSQSDIANHTEYFATPFFLNEATLKCQFATLTRFQGSNPTLIITLPKNEKMKSTSVSVIENKTISLFCKIHSDVLKYISKQHIRVILGSKKALFFNANSKKDIVNQKDTSENIFLSASNDDLIEFLVAVGQSADVNQVDQETGWSCAHFACASSSADILQCLYGSYPKALAKLEAHLEATNAAPTNIDLVGALDRARSELEPLIYDVAGNLPSSLVRGLALHNPIGDFARKLHSMVLAAEINSSRNKNLAFDSHYSLDM